MRRHRGIQTNSPERLIVVVSIAIAIVVLVAGFSLKEYSKLTEKTNANQVSLQSRGQKNGIYKILDDHAKIQAVILGDSIANGSGATSNATTWFNALTNKIYAKYPNTYITWDNKSKGGTTADYSLSRAQEVNPTVDVIFICVGRNDVTKSDVKTFAKNYRSIIDKLKASAPTASIFLMTEPQQLSNDDSKYQQFRQTILDMGSEYQLPVIDEWSAFPHDKATLQGLLTDITHPNDKGNELLSNTAFAALEKVLTQQ